MLTRILLIRHGATMLSLENRFAGSTDVDLSDEGRRQAEALGKRLAKEKIAAAYASPLRRARITAERVVKAHGLEVATDAGLAEINHGEWEGQVHAEVEKSQAAFYAIWARDPFLVAPPGGETGLDVLARALPALNRIVNRHPGETVLVGSHKATNRILIACLLGLDMRLYRERIDQDLACLNIIEFKDASSARMKLLNDTAHCAPAAW